MENKLLILSDIHGRTFWKDAVEKYKDEVDKIIFLGDYLDRYEDEGITRKQEMENFKEIIEFKKENEEKVILLLGNHCLHYIYHNFPRSTRFNSSDAYTIRELFSSHMSLFKLAYGDIVGDKKYLFTHAGLMRSWYDRNKDIIGDLTVDNLNSLIDTPRGISALGELSSFRTWLGEKSGSIVWSDVRERYTDEGELNTSEDIDEFDYQIFGHTQLRDEPIITDKWACIDCRRAFLIDNDGILKKI